MDYIPQCIPDRRPLLTWLTVAFGALLFLLMITLTPIGFALGYSALSTPIYQAFSYVCHQIPERSFSIMGYPLAVCVRCTGIYGGFALGALVYPAVKALKRVDAPDRKWLFAGALPLALDFALDFLGIWQNSQFSRFLTGAILGIAVVFFVLPGIIELSLRRKRSVDTKSGDGVATIIPEKLASAPSDYSSPHRRI